MIMTGIAQFIAACFGTIAFSVMFLVPREYYRDCGIIGGLGWMIYWLGTGQGGLSPFIATLLATVFVSLASRINSARRKCPATIFLLPVIFPLVPGIGIYRTIYYLIMDEADTSGEYARQAFGVAVAIVLGIMIVYEIPQKTINKIRLGRTGK